MSILKKREAGRKVIDCVVEKGFLEYKHQVNMMQLIVDYVTKDLQDDPLR